MLLGGTEEAARGLQTAQEGSGPTILHVQTGRNNHPRGRYSIIYNHTSVAQTKIVSNERIECVYISSQRDLAPASFSTSQR